MPVPSVLKRGFADFQVANGTRPKKYASTALLPALLALAVRISARREESAEGHCVTGMLPIPLAVPPSILARLMSVGRISARKGESVEGEDANGIGPIQPVQLP